ncbi:hypothetical protein GE061_001082 [Apolygus lucorum]|uniref:beta-N-acetylhexosaminidase n=1 Tax=Apolygus lucorum TaxID=248454 RepID=A0A8S9Y799_APOLU|nr:hypothetical protein GE061_001082 [Apolygus lucorum]
MEKLMAQKRYCRAPNCDATSVCEHLFQSPRDPASESLVVEPVTVEIEGDNNPGSTSQASDVGYVKSPNLLRLENVDGNCYSYNLDLEGMGSSNDISGVQHLSNDILTRVDVLGSPLTGASSSVWSEVAEEVPDSKAVHSRPLSTSTPLRTASKKLVFGSALSTSGATSDITSSLAGMNELSAPLLQGSTGTPGSSKSNSILRLIGETRYSSLTPRKQKLVQEDMIINGQKATMIAKWEDILGAYEENCLNLTRSMHKITKDHLDPKHQKSMKVNLAAQIFSRTVTATIETCVRHVGIEGDETQLSLLSLTPSSVNPIPRSLNLVSTHCSVCCGCGHVDIAVGNSETHAMKRLILSLWLVGLTSSVQLQDLDTPKDNYSDQPWTWECLDDKCTKQLNLGGKNPTSFDVCRLTCAPGVLWPKPTGTVVISKTLVPININTIFVKSKFPDGESSANSAVRGLVKKAGKRFVDNTSAKVKGTVRVLGKTPTITLNIRDESVTVFQQHADESYQLDVSPNSGEVNVNIAAETFLGARHGMETLSQLIVFDSVSGGLVMPSEVRIVDKPKYTHRGILLDTARNFVSLDVIKKTIEGMAMNKLNTFHWHITDSHSFPFESKSYPQLTNLGAYSPSKVYTEDDIANLVEFSSVRGVRVLPEFDAPAHVGEGWQWADDATVCVNKQPWRNYCVEPPCGQLNPTSEKMYSILEGIYKDMEKLFDSDIFHMGGDEVNINCWNTTDIVVENMKKKGLGRSDDDFHKLWADFQDRAARIHEKVAGKAKKNRTVDELID